MSYLKIDQKDFKIILSVAGILPVICFVGGFYTGSANQAGKSVNEILPDQVITERDATVQGRSEMGDLYANQIEIAPVESLNHDLTMSEHYVGAKSDIIEYRNVSNDSAGNLADVMVAHSQLPAESRQRGAGDLDSSERAKPERILRNVISIESFNKYMVQAGRFSSYDNAIKLQTQLAEKNILSQMALDDSAARPAFLVIVASFVTKKEAKRYCLFVEKLYKLDFYVKASEFALKKQGEAFVSL
jgi:hypothetical protein